MVTVSMVRLAARERLASPSPFPGRHETFAGRRPADGDRRRLRVSVWDAGER
jgi:hypothetical protein